MPNAWGQHTGWGCSLSGFRRPDTPLAWDDHTAHKTVECKEAMVQLNTGTTLFLLPGGLTPKVHPCDGLVDKLVESNMALYDHRIHGFAWHQAQWPRLPGAPLQEG